MREVCFFIGHNEVEEEDKADLVLRVMKVVEQLILYRNVDTFLFGNTGAFNAICYKVVTHYKEKYPDLIRVYVPCPQEAGFERPSDIETGKAPLHVERVYWIEKLAKAGKAGYVERNQIMIDDSSVCVFYFGHGVDADGKIRGQRKSGTCVAYEYAMKKHKAIINTYIFNRTK